MTELSGADIAGLVLLAALTGVLTACAVVFLLRRVQAGPGGRVGSRPDVGHVTPVPGASSRSGSAVSAGTAAAAEQARELLRVAEEAAREVRARAVSVTAEVEGELREVRDQLGAQRSELERREVRLAEQEERLSADITRLRRERVEAADAARALLQREQALEAAEVEASRALAHALERVAGVTASQARAELIASVEKQAKRDAAARVRDIERAAGTEADARAREIITTAVQRVAGEQTADAVVSVLHLPGEEMKGRIIGREGRNIRSFEAVTGVNVIVDDTPETVVLSCFDPVRREVARHALEALVLDGRIHPHRIEEQVEKSRGAVERVCDRAAEDALVEVGVADLAPELMTLLGRLKLRTSYGQNVLAHLVESAHLGAAMASELGLDPTLVARCALLHDIGKAVTHEQVGSHALVGADLARRHGESPDVVHAIEAHHGEVEPRTLEAVLTQAADAISASRPGARRESLEAYVSRLRRLEEISLAHEGVDRAYAMQAGREVRVMVLPDAIDDVAAQVLARDIAKQVEEELSYPGQVRVTVVRESRATEYAR